MLSGSAETELGLSSDLCFRAGIHVRYGVVVRRERQKIIISRASALNFDISGCWAYRRIEIVCFNLVAIELGSVYEHLWMLKEVELYECIERIPTTLWLYTLMSHGHRWW